MIEDKQEFTEPVDRDARLVRFLAGVMGWKLKRDKLTERLGWYDADGDGYPAEGEGRWDPLTNDTHAGQVMDRMAVKGFEVESYLRVGKWQCFFSKGYPLYKSTIEVQGNPSTEADFKAARLRSVCEAAAKAHGWEG